jgi:hypothetical protein
MPTLVLGTRPSLGSGAAGQDGGVISVALARALRDAGLAWSPARGDRFIVADKGMDEEVFVLSDMTIELHQFPGGPVFGFNGTTEWALDSLEQREALWLPAEHQLRDLLGDAFDRLERQGGGYLVHTRPPNAETVHTGPPSGNGASPYAAADPAEAYGLALLSRLRAFPAAAAGPVPAE